MVEEELRQEAEALAVDLRLRPVHLVDGNGVLAVDLPSRRRPLPATDLVAAVGALVAHVLQAELADPQLRLLPVLLRVGAEVPGVNLVLAKLNAVDVLHLGDGLVLPLQRRRRRVHLREALLHVVDLIVFALLISGQLPVAVVRVEDDGGVDGGRVDLRWLHLLRLVDRGAGDPLVQAAVEALVVDVELVVDDVARLVADGADLDDLGGV